MPPNTKQQQQQQEPNHAVAGEATSLLGGTAGSHTLASLFEKPASSANDKHNSVYDGRILLQPSATAIFTQDSRNSNHHYDDTINNCTAATIRHEITPTLIGSLTFCLYHVVYCLAQASTITRPHADHSSVGVMAKLAALGTLLSAPVFVLTLGHQVPAIYPASDLFLSPFLAQVAADIDASLFTAGLANNDASFLATFGALIGVGFLASGLLCILAARIKLANLGSFLPYCVLCGFFTTIGILIWSLGFSVDTGMKVGELWHYTGDENFGHVLSRAVLHHAPSFTIGVIMHIVGQRNSLYVIALIFATLIGSYAMLWCTGTTLEQAQEMNWFFSSKELQDPSFFATPDDDIEKHHWWDNWIAPATPLGAWALIWQGHVHWPSFRAGLSTMSALAFLYLIRCSLHAAALKKNIPHVTRQPPPPPTSNHADHHHGAVYQSIRQSTRSVRNDHSTSNKPLTLGKILEEGYAYSQLIAALTGGIAVAPAVAASLTLFKLGCEGVAPQYGSILLVLIFYLTNFQLVQYIPKPAVSCLMVLAGLDMCKTWLVSSYFKTKAKLEWMVAPVIVILAFTVGMLNAIFLGVAISTFIFVGNFYKAGTVKFVGNGLNLRSIVERGVPETAWLNQNGDLIQILVLQNYLFFGNAQSVLNYAMTMFAEPTLAENSILLGGGDGPAGQSFVLPPKPKYIVIDFTIVTGMDTSATDILREITEVCRTHHCKLYLSGLSPSLRSMLIYAKLGPSRHSGPKTLLFAPDLESALAKAEDGLIQRVSPLGDKDESESHAVRLLERKDSEPTNGFLLALKMIDEQHGLETVKSLAELSRYTTAIDLGQGDILPWENKTHHGLFFIEYGHLRIEHAADHTVNKTFPSRQVPLSSVTQRNRVNPASNTSIGHLNARSETIGRQTAFWKEASGHNNPEPTEQNFRLARLGAGWVVGMIEECSGMRRAGVYVAVTSCRLHHLHYESMKLIEKDNPNLMMNLYKVMSSLSLKRQEMTIGQLAQFVSIMSSPSPTEPTSRVALARFSGANP